MESILSIQKELKNKREHIYKQYKDSPDLKKISYDPDHEKYKNALIENFKFDSKQYSKRMCNNEWYSYGDDEEPNLSLDLIHKNIVKIATKENIQFLHIDDSKYHCKKNNYIFDIVVNENGKKYDGYIFKVFNEFTNETYKIQTHLFYDENTPAEKSMNFCCLLDCKDKKEFFQKRYYKWIELCSVLNNAGFEASFMFDFMNIDEIVLNFYEINFVIKMKYQNKECYLIPELDCSELTIAPTKEYVLEKVKNKTPNILGKYGYDEHFYITQILFVFKGKIF